MKKSCFIRAAYSTRLVTNGQMNTLPPPLSAFQ